MKPDHKKVPSSFRDPSGFLFFDNGILYRQVNKDYRENYDHLMTSGLYKNLTELNFLIKHQEVDFPPPEPALAYKVIKPEQIPFISYPYEWCFSQLKNAALATLEIQKTAVKFGMSLKDTSGYNIQFKNGKPILIDTLSFEIYKEGEPWVAYRQFCQHFLGPLLLMSYKDCSLNQLLKLYIDGIPLGMTSKLLPFYTRFIPRIAVHIYLHAFSQKFYANKADKSIKTSHKKIKRSAFIGIIDSLERVIKKTKFRVKKSEWGSYYEDTNYSAQAFAHKKKIVEEFLEIVKPGEVWDLGANRGIFSRIANKKGIKTISFDIDTIAVEKNYQESLSNNEINFLPLCLDLTNPSPAIGWENEERMSLIERGPTDMVLALALVHHLAISNNLPLKKTAAFFKNLCSFLVIEFIPKTDSQVQRMLATRDDIFSQYDQVNFEKEFSRYFSIQKIERIKDSERILYLMQSKDV